MILDAQFVTKIRQHPSPEISTDRQMLPKDEKSLLTDRLIMRIINIFISVIKSYSGVDNNNKCGDMLVRLQVEEG